MAVRIITDTSADFDLQDAKKKNITIIPMSLTYGDETLLATYEIDNETFYKRLLENKEIPVTSQPSPDLFLQEFKKAKEAGDSVVAIIISGTLSGTLQSAVLAKQICEYDEIYIIDSQNATVGQKILVTIAANMANEGKTATEIAEKLEQLKEKVRVYAVVDTLEYLYKGGRLSKAEAGLGTLASIKPVLQVTQEGNVAVLYKCVGRKRARRQLLETIQSASVDESYPAFYLYSADRENCLDFQAELEKVSPLTNCSEMVELGPTIGTHVGGGAYGLAFIEK